MMLHILPPSSPSSRRTTSATATVQATDVQHVCAELGAPLTIVETWPGPRHLTYVATLNHGVRYSDLRRAIKDVPVALGVPAIRLGAGLDPNTVTLQITWKASARVSLREVLTSDDNLAALTLPLTVGLDARGEALHLDLATAPHLLIGGVTGSGKSTALTAILTGVTLLKSPDEVELVLIDPKQVDLMPFAELPHTRQVVAQTPAEALDRLQAVDREMTFRFTELKLAKVRDLAAYNAWAHQTPDEEPMRHVVVVVDELVSLVQDPTAGSAIEALLVRLAQLGRAAGIHLICATQRPSAKVLSTELRSQFPMRLAFRVTTATDSRLILDAPGAEQLEGAGDGLLRTPDGAVHRLQGALVEDVFDLTSRLAAEWGPAESDALPCVPTPVAVPVTFPITRQDPEAPLRWSDINWGAVLESLAAWSLFLCSLYGAWRLLWWGVPRLLGLFS